jgi:hypothetical protein
MGASHWLGTLGQHPGSCHCHNRKNSVPAVVATSGNVEHECHPHFVSENPGYKIYSMRKSLMKRKMMNVFK